MNFPINIEGFFDISQTLSIIVNPQCKIKLISNKKIANLPLNNKVYGTFSDVYEYMEINSYSHIIEELEYE